MSTEKEKITIDYSGDQVPESVKNFRPDVYRDGDQYCLILGSGKEAVTGCGNSVDEAMQQWDAAYWNKRHGSENNK